MTIDSRVRPSLPDELLDMMDVAAGLGACRSTVREILATGQLRSVRLGGKIKIKKSEFARFLEALPAARPAAGEQAA